jgi:fatty-acid desaturase
MGFVDKTYPFWALLPFVVSFVIGGLAWHDFLVGGVHMVIWTNFICLFLTYMLTGLVNSSGHMHPERRSRTHDYSQNFGGKIWPIVALLTAGESFHGYHHDSQRTANLGRLPIEIAFDPGTHVIWLLEKLGIAWDVNWSWKQRSKSSPAPTV